MTQIRKTILVLLVSCFCLTIVQGQSAIPSTGGNATGTGGAVSYTVGQVVYNTVSGTTGTITHGVQQPFEISVVTGNEEAKGIILEISVYPNPATNFIKLKIENYDVKNLRFQLYDINGSLLQDNKIQGNETSILMNNYVPATYFLNVTDKTKVLKTFKVIIN